MSLLRPQTIPSPSWTTAYLKYKTTSLNPKLVKINPLRVKNYYPERGISVSCSTKGVYSPKESSFKNLPCGSHFLSRFLRYLLKFVLSPYGRCIYCVGGGGGGGGRIFSCRMKNLELEENSSLNFKSNT